MQTSSPTGGQDMLRADLAYALPRAHQARERGQRGYATQYARAALAAATDLADTAAVAKAQAVIAWAARARQRTERRGLTTYHRHMAACRAARARQRAGAVRRTRAAPAPVVCVRARRRGAGRPAARRTSRSTRAGPSSGEDGPAPPPDGPHDVAALLAGAA